MGEIRWREHQFLVAFSNKSNNVSLFLCTTFQAKVKLPFPQEAKMKAINEVGFKEMSERKMRLDFPSNCPMEKSNVWKTFLMKTYKQHYENIWNFPTAKTRDANSSNLR